MRPFLGNLRTIPARTRWVALAAIALVALFLVWFFLFRNPNTPGVTAPPAPRPALGKVLPIAQYLAAVDSALSDVRGARSLSGDERKKKLESAAASLEKVEGSSVEAPGGVPSEVDNTSIITELRSDSPNVIALESSLAALSESLHNPKQGDMLADTANAQEAISELRSVLSDPAFDYESNLSPLQRLVRWLNGLTGKADPGDTLWRWVLAFAAAVAAGIITFLASERLGNRWVRLGVSVVAGLVIGPTFYVAASNLDITVEILGVVGLFVAAIAAALIFSGARMASVPSKPRALSELASVLGMSASEARKRAEESAGEGDYRTAIRYRCLAVLLALDEVGKLAFDRSATDREYLFHAPGTMQDDLQTLLTHFEAVWYGDAPTTEDDWTEYTAWASQLETRAAAEARLEEQDVVRPGRSAA